MTHRLVVPFLLLSFVCLLSWGQSQSIAQTADSIEEALRGKTAMPGYFPLYWDDNTGRLWMIVDKWETEFLYVNSLAAGVGSNDIGLDRGQLGDRRIVFFRKIGAKVLLMQPNYGFRADSSDTAERSAVAESFAQSVVWGFKAEKASGNRVLIDITDFALRDAHGVMRRLRLQREGEFFLDASRSAIYLERTNSFPKNTEVEALLTFTTDRPIGNYLRSVAASETEFSVRQHHSFIELPDAGYTPRPFDPRSGYFTVGYMDYAAPIDADIVKRWIPRHRLKKKDPAAAVSEPVEPIVYYVDRGAPEPIRGALLEGARWWNQAFEAIGYRNAYRVELMPEGVDPMDVRYNVIQWVHRSTRGWSYGSSVIDPRTGEIIKGHVTLGSLRVRQDYLIATGLLAPYEEGKPVSPQMREMALARLRQLSAHEVGHTLGLAHNFAASINKNASVMDYPHPYIALGEGDAIDLSNSYATEMGEWDNVTIAYGYQDFASGTDEAAELQKILNNATARGLLYITDRDARPTGGASPDGHLWDNGLDPTEELKRLSKVRTKALERFSENVLRPGQPLASMGEILVPVYLLHRYQTEGVAKSVGGVAYSYAVRPTDGSQLAVTAPVSADRQTAALQTLLTTVQPEFLRIPDSLLAKIPPHPPGFGRTQESFRSSTGLTFDPLAAATSSADHTIALLLHPERAARLVLQAASNSALPGLEDVIRQLRAVTIESRPRDGMEGEIQRAVNGVVLYRLMVLAHSPDSTEQVKAIAWNQLKEVKDFLSTSTGGGKSWQVHREWMSSRINRFQEDPKEISLPAPRPLPPGQPIGCGEESWNSARDVPNDDVPAY